MADFSQVELGPKMLALTERERRFVWAFLENGGKDATAAARVAGYSDPGLHSAAIRVRGHEVRYRPRVIEAMREVAHRHFQGLFVRAVSVVEEVLENKRHPGRLTTAFSVLSRLGLGERSALDVNVGGEVTVNHTDEALEHLRMLRALDVPRAKLEEIFGFSGLQRYERMLAELERKAAPKLIEGEVIDERDGTDRAEGDRASGRDGAGAGGLGRDRAGLPDAGARPVDVGAVRGGGRSSADGLGDRGGDR